MLIRLSAKSFSGKRVENAGSRPFFAASGKAMKAAG
jgi:hypothetical protein